MAKLRKQNKWCHLQIDTVGWLCLWQCLKTNWWFSFSHWGFLINIAEVANSFFLNNPMTAVENGTSCSGPRLRQGSMEYWNQRKNSPPSCPSQPIVMFSSVKKYSKKATFNKVKNSNDQNLSSFGTFQTPFLFGNVKKLAIHVSIFCRGGHNSCAVGWLAVYQVQRVLTIICCCYCSTTEICFCAMNVCL